MFPRSATQILRRSGRLAWSENLAGVADNSIDVGLAQRCAEGRHATIAAVDNDRSLLVIAESIFDRLNVQANSATTVSTMALSATLLIDGLALKELLISIIGQGHALATSRRHERHRRNQHTGPKPLRRTAS